LGNLLVGFGFIECGLRGDGVVLRSFQVEVHPDQRGIGLRDPRLRRSNCRLCPVDLGLRRQHRCFRGTVVVLVARLTNPGQRLADLDPVTLLEVDLLDNAGNVVRAELDLKSGRDRSFQVKQELPRRRGGLTCLLGIGVAVALIRARTGSCRSAFTAGALDSIVAHTHPDPGHCHEAAEHPGQPRSATGSARAATQLVVEPELLDPVDEFAVRGGNNGRDVGRTRHDGNLHRGSFCSYSVGVTVHLLLVETETIRQGFWTVGPLRPSKWGLHSTLAVTSRFHRQFAQLLQLFAHFTSSSEKSADPSKPLKPLQSSIRSRTIPDIVSAGVVMRSWWVVATLLVSLGGCRGPAPTSPRTALATTPPTIELPRTTPTIPVLDAAGLPATANRTIRGAGAQGFRKLTETDCLLLAAANTAGASLLKAESGLPTPSTRRSAKDCSASPGQLRESIRYHAALELRNRSAAEALERFHQLAEAEAVSDLARKGLPIIDPLLAKAREARARNVRYPLDPDDLERQRSQLLTQLEQLDLASRLLNLDLKRRIGLPYQPESERLWPAGDFTIDPVPTDPEQAATAALADRPALRGLRALHAGLTPDMLPDVRELLGVLITSGGTRGAGLSFALVLKWLGHQKGPDPATLAELEVRRRQLGDLIATRERQIADEARAAALVLNSQRVRATLARDRLRSWDEKLADAVRRLEANQPNAELLEAQVRLEWLKAKGDLTGEVAAWHRARVKLRAAMGWLAWEAVGTPSGPIPPRLPCPTLPPITTAAPDRAASGPPAASALPGQ
jgi:hypothetical protein